MIWALVYDSDMQPIPLETFATEAEAKRALEKYRRRVLKKARTYMTPKGIERTKRMLQQDYFVHEYSSEDLHLLGV